MAEARRQGLAAEVFRMGQSCRRGASAESQNESKRRNTEHVYRKRERASALFSCLKSYAHLGARRKRNGAHDFFGRFMAEFGHAVFTLL